MRAIAPGGPRAARRSRDGRGWGAPIEAIIAVLEVVGSEQPDLLEFQAHVLWNGTMSFAFVKLAGTFGLPPQELGGAIGRACRDLDHLEKRRGIWRDPKQVLGPRSNLAALSHLCQARLRRVRHPPRRRRLERMYQRLEAAYAQARTRAWIDDFIGPLANGPREVKSDDR
jgi:hypothetical protein